MYLTERSITIICLGAFSTAVIIYALYTRSKNLGSSHLNFDNSKRGEENNQKFEATRTGERFYANSPTGIAIQYENGNPGWAMKDRHPVLEYQMARNNEIGGSTPATAGDIFAPPDIAGPMRSGSFAYNSKMIRPYAPVPGYGADVRGRYGGFGDGMPGPSVSDPRGMGVPVPAGSLKYYNERYNKESLTRGPGTREPWRSSGIPFQNPPSMATSNPITGSGDFYRPYGPNSSMDTAPFFGSVDAYSPFPEIVTPWEKAGLLTSLSKDGAGTTGGSNILNLFRRPIAPLQDLWEYQVQDKNGFVIKLGDRYLEDGDIVRHVIGKEGLGPWKVHNFVQNKFVWV